MRIEKSMDVALTREMEHLESRLTSLATIGSAGPFVGLFGTVIGIMTSFLVGTLGSIGMGTPESIIRVEVAADSAPADLPERFRQRLRIVQAMVRDFQPMKRRMQDLADDYLRAATAEGGERSLNLRETEGMVRWLCEENYVLLSVEEYDEAGPGIRPAVS